jgi:hypothetical protein
LLSNRRGVNYLRLAFFAPFLAFFVAAFFFAAFAKVVPPDSCQSLKRSRNPSVLFFTEHEKKVIRVFRSCNSVSGARRSFFLDAETRSTVVGVVARDVVSA